MESEEHPADCVAARVRKNLPEVEVEREDDTVLARSLGEDVGIGQSVEALLREMNRIVAFTPQPLNEAASHPHVSEEAHRGAPYDPAWTSS